jgi:pimeloyl-ACP methyl ester carboxylesterase
MAEAGIGRVRRAYVESDEGQIHYRWFETAGPRDEGGTPALLLHQISSSSRMYERLMPFLAGAGYRPVAMDFPGFGESDPPEAGYGIPQYVDSVVRFLDALGLREPLPVMGHHTGAKVAVELAGTHPARVSHLVVVGLPYYEDVAARDQRWAEKKVAPIIPRADAGHILHEWERLKDLSPEMDPALLHRELVDTLKADRYDAAYEATFPYDIADRLPRLACPTLVMGGTRDVQRDFRQQAAAKLIPGAKFALIQDGGVFMLDERVDEVAEVVRSFLGRRS